MCQECYTFWKFLHNHALEKDVLYTMNIHPPPGILIFNIFQTELEIKCSIMRKRNTPDVTPKCNTPDNINRNFSTPMHWNQMCFLPFFLGTFIQYLKCLYSTLVIAHQGKSLPIDRSARAKALIKAASYSPGDAANTQRTHTRGHKSIN